MLALLRGVAVNKMKLKWRQITRHCCKNQCFRHLDSPCRLPKCSINILISGIGCTICDVYYQFLVSCAKFAYIKLWTAHPWKHSGPSWMEPWAPWSTGWQPARSNEMTFKVLSNVSHLIIFR